jgi:predicted O-linked N-acetylglucosamine transferase (SPINDLY family)
MPAFITQTTKTLIITGMHRSGTSLTAAFLQYLGVNIGKNLLKSSYANPQGYFEDVDFLSFQRQLLSSCCRQEERGFPDWGWTESELLDKQQFSRYLEPAKRLIFARQNQSQIWGWKDPRTTLLLDFWRGILPDAGYVLIYRYPWDVADSILRLNVPFFRENPDFCLRVWRFYNWHLLDFYQRNRDRSLLININTLLEYPEIFVSFLKSKFQFSLPETTQQNIKPILNSVYKPELMKALPFNHPLIKLLAEVSSGRYFELLEELDKNAHLPSQFSRKSWEGDRRSLEYLALQLHRESLPLQITPNSPEFINLISGLVEEYQNLAANQNAALSKLRETRQQIANLWLSLPTEKLKIAYFSYLGKAHKLILKSGIRDEPITPKEYRFLGELEREVAKGFETSKSLQYFLAAMLYRRAEKLQINFNRIAVPQWFLNEFLEFIFAMPSYFGELGEVESYANYLENLVDLIHGIIMRNPDSQVWQHIAKWFGDLVNFMPLYFTERNLKNIYQKRGEILEFLLRKDGHILDYKLPPRPKQRQKIRLGVLKFNFAAVAETFTTIPVFEYLDREKFEVIIYVFQITGEGLEKYCQSRANKWVKLPEKLPEQVELIRGDNLDILFVGSIVTNAAQEIILLSLHRLARIQATYFASPATTGIRNMDYYISGTLTESLESRSHYSEELITMEGTGFCFNYELLPQESRRQLPETRLFEKTGFLDRFSRQELGIPEGATVFASGANVAKIVPEVRESWAKILAAVPDAVLLLYPFGGGWSRNDCQTAFINNMYARLEKYGVERRRLVVLNTLPSRTEVKEVLKLADVYLDSYPFAGANSLADPLEVGLATVTLEGKYLRSRQGAAMLRELGMLDLIADSEESYIELSIGLGRDRHLREAKGLQIGEKMERSRPKFRDSRAYSVQMGAIFEELVGWRSP